MKRDLEKEGYSKEEAYFRKLNQELLEKLKKKDEEKKETDEEKKC